MVINCCLLESCLLSSVSPVLHFQGYYVSFPSVCKAMCLLWNFIDWQSVFLKNSSVSGSCLSDTFLSDCHDCLSYCDAKLHVISVSLSTCETCLSVNCLFLCSWQYLSVWLISVCLPAIHICMRYLSVCLSVCNNYLSGHEICLSGFLSAMLCEICLSVITMCIKRKHRCKQYLW